MLLLFVPIGIMVDLSENIDKMIAKQAPADAILWYYFHFTIHFANLLFPFFLFLSIIWFTSKLANNTEIIAILSSGVSFMRFLRPYIVGASLVATVVFFMGMFIVPAASKGYNEFRANYIKRNKPSLNATALYNQINDDEIIYVSSFNGGNKVGYNFTLEHFNDNKLEYKLSAQSIRFEQKDSTYHLTNYVKRTIGEKDDIIEQERVLDTIFPFKMEDLVPVDYVAETKNLFELNDFIEKEKQKGSGNISGYQFNLYKRWASPLTAFILTFIAVAVSSMKRRGGMGVNLLFGIAIAFVFIFFDKVFGVLAESSGFPPLLAVAIPNIVFGVLAFFLLRNAKR
ncbi:lipopolysaccharide export system permease protein [Pustulibacterium marinum]|uniref:Lipopolysaccharide export system permease protein n=2 Tax=Pustulibacterium marinum TaxID=1224947 RepID=A0A1I7FQH3_9FLAO|nr:lipopolysaccharide export system permease protein [Pustulibacterium marinum]